jgi:hypothetical protein
MLEADEGHPEILRKKLSVFELHCWHSTRGEKHGKEHSQRRNGLDFFRQATASETR